MKGLTLSQREQARLQVLNRVLEGVYGVEEAAKVLGSVSATGGDFWQPTGRRVLLR